MIPIFEQGDGRGIGLGLDEFTERFDAICAERLTANRAASFAFIFYDFNDRSFRRLLKDLGVFAQLDRLIRNKLSLFYLHTSGREGVEAFNSRFMQRLGLTGATLPCVVFFRIRKGEVENLEAVCLDQANLIHGFHELYGVVQDQIDEKAHKKPDGKSRLRWIKSSSKFVAIEAMRFTIREGIAGLIRTAT